MGTGVAPPWGGVFCNRHSERDSPGPSEEVCREVLNRWLSAEPGAGEAERTWGSVLEALETSGHRQVAEQLRREQIGESPVFCIGWLLHHTH